MAAILDAPHFNSAEAAREHLEAIRWPDGPYCPHCGGTERIHRVEGKGHRPGLYACRDCSGHFTATVGTLFERSHIPLHQWFKAVYFICSSKKGISAHQLHRTLGVTYKTAWFMAHRIREAMRGTSTVKLGGKGKIVEADETYYGPTTVKKSKGRRGVANKRAVVALVERGGTVRSFHVEDHPTIATTREIVTGHVLPSSGLRTDESRLYAATGKAFASHETVNHTAGEYVRGDAHTNTIDGYFSIFKRGMRGIYQHCGERHLHRYLAEFDFRYSNRTALGVSDSQRMIAAMKGIEGKRLMYRPTSC